MSLKPLFKVVVDQITEFVYGEYILANYNQIVGEVVAKSDL